MKKILYIKPSAYSNLNGVIEEYLNKYKDEDTEIDVINPPRGPKHLTYLYYQALASHELLKIIRRADLDGYDAAIIGCFDDPVLYEAREMCDRMVVAAPAEASLHIAATLGDSFSIIVGQDKWVPHMRNNVRKYGFAEKLASFRIVGLGVPEFHADEAYTAGRMRQEIAEAIAEDKAETIILGCTMEFGFFEELQREFKVPIIDSMLAALKYAEMLVGIKQKMNWYTSKRGLYASPNPEELKEWNIEKDYDLPGLWSRK